MATRKTYTRDKDGKYPFLSFCKDDKVTQICKVNDIDLAPLKTKDSKIQALESFDWIYAEGLPDADQASDHDHGPKLRNFHRLEDKEDVYNFLDSFVTQATFQNINQKQWPQVLQPFLTGPAANAWSFLDSDQRESWETVKSEILSAYRLSPEAYRIRFFKYHCRNGQTFFEYANSAKQNFLRWVEPTEDMKKNAEFKQIVEKIVVGQMLEKSIIDDDLKCRIADGEQTIEKAARAADDYYRHHRRPQPDSGRPGGRSGGPNGGRRPSGGQYSGGTTPTDAESKLAEAEFKKKREFRDQLRKDHKCFTCYEKGHDAKSCPNKDKKGKVSAIVEISECENEISEEGAFMPVKINDKYFWAYADTGAPYSFLSKNTVEDLELEVGPSDLRLAQFDGSELQVLGACKVKFEFGTSLVEHEFIVADVSLPVSIGRDLNLMLHLVFDFSDQAVWSTDQIPVVKYPLVLKFGPGLEEKLKGRRLVNASTSSNVSNTHQISSDFDNGPSLPGISHLDEEGQEMNPEAAPRTDYTISGCEGEAEKLKEEFPKLFDEEHVGGSDRILHRIETTDDIPVYSQPYYLSPKKQKAAEEQVDKLESKDIIEKSKSQYNSNPVLIEKDDGDWRFALDFRKLNRKTISDPYRLPTQETLMAKIHKAKVKSKLDLKWAFLQNYIHPDDRKKTAFLVQGKGQYHFKRLAYGLKNSSAHFQKVLDMVLIEETGCSLSFVDDIMVYSEDVEQHKKDIRRILRKLEDAGFTLNIRKCKFFQSELPFIGLWLSDKGINLRTAKTDAIDRYPRPTEIKSLMRFLGMVAWCSKFIPKLAEVTEPLNRLKRKDVTWEWSEECENAFIATKKAIGDTVALATADFSRDMEVHCDASNIGIGAMLCQRRGQGDEKKNIIAFASRTLNRAERNYSASEKEILALVWALEHWRFYVESAPNTVCYTDHQALTWLWTSEKIKGRLYRWVLRLQDFKFEVHYKPGFLNLVPDALSRAPLPEKVSALSEQYVEYDKNECHAEDCKQDDADVVNWVECDQCSKWYHCQCVDLTLEEANAIAEFICAACGGENLASGQDKDGEVSSTNTRIELDRKLCADEQSEDQFAKGMLKYKKNGTLPREKSLKKKILSMSKYFTVNDRVIDQPILVKGKKQTYIPKPLVKVVIEHYHSKPLAGHWGVRKTVAKIQRAYWWPKMARDIRSFIRACQRCQYGKHQYKKPAGMMESTTSSSVWEAAGIDYMGPFPETPIEGYQHLLVIVDHFSKFTFLVPVRRASGKILTAVMSQLYCRFGASSKLISDNGPAMTSLKFKNFLSDWGVKQTLCATYHPQSNWVERANRNIKSMMSCFIESDHTTWANHLAEFEFAINSSISDATGVTPAEVFLGRELIGPGDKAVLDYEPQPVPRKIHKSVSIQLDKQAKDNKAKYDQKRRQESYQLYELVLLKAHPLSNAKRKFTAKLAPKWRGPYKIQKKISPLNYKIAHIDNKKDERIAHVEQLKLYNV